MPMEMRILDNAWREARDVNGETEANSKINRKRRIEWNEQHPQQNETFNQMINLTISASNEYINVLPIYTIDIVRTQ